MEETDLASTYPLLKEDVLVIPVNIGSLALLVTVRTGEQGYHVDLTQVGRGKFILGDDNTTFGRWNALVAYTPRGEVIDILPGHGGEIIPGNLDDHIERLRENIATGQRLPVQMDLDISMACASHCSFCFSANYRSSRKNQLMMERELLLDILRNWAAFGVKVVRFDGGGDPLTHPHLLEAIQFANDLGIQTAVLTSGDLLNERQHETFVSCRTYVRVSLNAGSDATRLSLHQPARNKYTLSHVLGQIRQLADLRQAVYGHEAKRQMLLGATSMMHPRNYADAFSIAQCAKEAGFDHLSFRVILGEEHAVHFTTEMLSSLEMSFERIRQELVDDEFIVFFPTRSLSDTGYVPSKFFQECLACTHRVLIEVGHCSDTAAIIPCGRYRGHGFRWSPQNAHRLTVLGHIRQATSVQEVWMTPHMSNLVQSFPQSCNDCIDRSANLFFGRIHDVLSRHKDAQFFKFALE
ncbi:MAG: radical SAM protein [Ktedonobacteraceae bacterium]|nr:radical SAM protein [Ktedonobacteraceae bacterium]